MMFLNLIIFLENLEYYTNDTNKIIETIRLIKYYYIGTKFY